MRYLNLIFVLIIFSVAITKGQNINYQAQEGDILFQDLNCGELCTAIKQVTIGIDSAEFSHIGLVQNIGGKWKVMEAISDGVKHTPLLEFFKRSIDTNGNPKIWVGRVKSKYRAIIPMVKEISASYLYIPYDDLFLMNNGKYYCSELLYELFKKANNDNDFFELEPMTFKDLKSKQFLKVWEEYYQKLGTPIPEGEPGINPAGISRSSKIEIVRKLGIVSRK